MSGAQNKTQRPETPGFMQRWGELFWLYEVVKRVLDRRLPDAHNALYTRFQDMMEDRRPSNVFCTCFSKEPDSHSQWLEYADDGHGFAIGFDPTTFNLERTPPVRDVQLKLVIYDEKEQERIAEEVLVPLVHEGGNEVLDQASLVFGDINTWWQGAYCKNPVFQNEKEWRLIQRDRPGDGLDFRERAGRQLIPFIKFPLNPVKNPIREIRLGPRNQSQRNVDAVTQLLQICGYDVGHVRFLLSRIPLRPEY